MDKSTYNPLGSSHGPFLLLSSPSLPHFFFFSYFSASEAHKRTGSCQCGGKFTASFPVYTQTHICSLLRIHIRSKPPLLHLPVQTNIHRAHRLSYCPVSRQAGLEMLETHPALGQASRPRIITPGGFVRPCPILEFMLTHTLTSLPIYTGVLQQIYSQTKRQSAEASRGQETAFDLHHSGCCCCCSLVV